MEVFEIRFAKWKKTVELEIQTIEDGKRFVTLFGDQLVLLYQNCQHVPKHKHDVWHALVPPTYTPSP